MLAYNRPQFMRTAIESVLNQTFRDFEFLILDNGSKGDEVYNIAKEYAGKDSRIQVSRVKDNLGVHLGRNKLLHQAQADYIATIEDDDFWALNKLEKQVQFMQENPDVGVYSCSQAFINEKGEQHRHSEKILNEAILPSTRNIKDMWLISGNYSGSGQMFQRDALLAVDGWRAYFITADDTDLFYRLQEKYRYASTSKKLMHYRIADKKSDAGYANLGGRADATLYHYMADLSALYRRQGKQDPIDDNPLPEKFVTNNILMILTDFILTDQNANLSIRYARKIVKWMLRHHHYIALRKFMRAYRQSNASHKGKMYLNLLAWSIWHGRLGWLWTRYNDNHAP